MKILHDIVDASNTIDIIYVIIESIDNRFDIEFDTLIVSEWFVVIVVSDLLTYGSPISCGYTTLHLQANENGCVKKMIVWAIDDVYDDVLVFRSQARSM